MHIWSFFLILFCFNFFFFELFFLQIFFNFFLFKSWHYREVRVGRFLTRQTRRNRTQLTIFKWNKSKSTQNFKMKQIEVRDEGRCRGGGVVSWSKGYSIGPQKNFQNFKMKQIEVRDAHRGPGLGVKGKGYSTGPQMKFSKSS